MLRGVGEGWSEPEMQNSAWQRMMGESPGGFAKRVFPQMPAGGAAHPFEAAGFQAARIDAIGSDATRFEATGSVAWSPWW